MAVLHRGLKYRPDCVEKHSITEDEVRFLLSLQEEMNTQDTVGQADPRYWVIRGTVKEYGVVDAYADDAELYCNNIKVADNMDEAYRYITDNLINQINIDGVKFILSMGVGCIYISQDKEKTRYDKMSDVVTWLHSHGFYSYWHKNYWLRSHAYNSTMFLTQKDAENHLKNNSHHYSNDAHTYAMTSWRSEETEMLWKILQTVDWQQLIQK